MPNCAQSPGPLQRSKQDLSELGVSSCHLENPGKQQRKTPGTSLHPHPHVSVPLNATVTKGYTQMHRNTPLRDETAFAEASGVGGMDWEALGETAASSTPLPHEPIWLQQLSETLPVTAPRTAGHCGFAQG